MKRAIEWYKTSSNSNVNVRVKPVQRSSPRPFVYFKHFWREKEIGKTATDFVRETLHFSRVPIDGRLIHPLVSHSRGIRSATGRHLLSRPVRMARSDSKLLDRRPSFYLAARSCRRPAICNANVRPLENCTTCVCAASISVAGATS